MDRREEGRSEGLSGFPFCIIFEQQIHLQTYKALFHSSHLGSFTPQARNLVSLKHSSQLQCFFACEASKTRHNTQRQLTTNALKPLGHVTTYAVTAHKPNTYQLSVEKQHLPKVAPLCRARSWNTRNITMHFFFLKNQWCRTLVSNLTWIWSTQLYSVAAWCAQCDSNFWRVPDESSSWKRVVAHSSHPAIHGK